jgi:hypothetical protein
MRKKKRIEIRCIKQRRKEWEINLKSAIRGQKA